MTNETKLSKAELAAREWIKDAMGKDFHSLDPVFVSLRKAGISDFLQGAKGTIEQAEQLAIKPEPVEVTQFEPFVYLKGLV